MKPKKANTLEIELKAGQSITKELIEDALGAEDLDAGDLGEPDETVEEKITFRRA